MTYTLKGIFFSSVLALFSFTTYAWNASGHMVVANIAYQQLKPEIRAKVDKLVNNFHTEYPNIHTFEQLSYWPDAIRAQKIETYTHWHYIEVALSSDGSPLKSLIDTDNAVWAVKSIQAVVKNAKANQYERARFLAFLIHIVADLHQPLHTVTSISAEHPDGDRGGNLFFIQYKNRRISLHRLWDGGIGIFEIDDIVTKTNVLANNISSLYPKAYFGKRAEILDPDEWVKEGVSNAERYVYNTAEEKPPTPLYLETSKQVTEQQVALAGYRLGSLLNLLIESKNPRT